MLGISPIHPLPEQVISQREISVHSFRWIIGPSGTTLLGTGHHRSPALAYYLMCIVIGDYDWVGSVKLMGKTSAGKDSDLRIGQTERTI